MVGIIVLQIVLIILNAIFSSAEISVISMNETKIKQMAEEGDRRAEKAVLLLEKPAKFLEAIQAAVTFAGLLSGAFVAGDFSGNMKCKKCIVGSFCWKDDCFRTGHLWSVGYRSYTYSYVCESAVW